MRTPPDRCPDDLFARAQRGPISVVERRALDAHLAVCDLCRATQALAALYEGLPDGSPPDEAALISRLANRALDRRFNMDSRHRARAVAFAAAAALLIAAGGAVAWVSTHRAVEPAAARPSSLPSPPPPPPADRAGPAGFSVSAASASPLAPPSPANTARAVAGPPTRRSATAPHAARPTPGAAELFAAANAARHAHDLRLAIHRYGLLQRDFPDSREAAVSHISAGDVLVRVGQPAAALAQFEGYLRSTPTGPLAPEALFRSASCLKSLGRRSEEMEVWRSLLRRFPASIYEQVARQGLLDERNR